MLRCNKSALINATDGIWFKRLMHKKYLQISYAASVFFA
jgi:hypothetical protein